MTRKPAANAPCEVRQTISGSDLADLLEVSPTWIRKLARDGVVKRVGRDEFDFTASVQGVIGNLLADRTVQRPEAQALNAAREEEILQRVAMRGAKLIESAAAAVILDDIANLALDELDKLPGEFAKDAKTRRLLTAAVDDIRSRVTKKLDGIQIEFRSSTLETGDEFT